MRARRTVVVAAMFLPAVTAGSWLVLAGDGSSAATKTTTCTADGTALSITASDNQFDKDCLAVPADQAFTIEFDNQDAGIPHNVSIYDKNNGDKALYTGEVTYGPKKITYSVPAQAEGTYEFRCDPHAEFMLGTFIVGNGGPPTTTTTAPPSTTTTTSLLNLPKILPNQ